MRMISQSLREESIDYTEPRECSRPWLRRRVEEEEVDAHDVAETAKRDGVLHVAPEV